MRDVELSQPQAGRVADSLRLAELVVAPSLGVDLGFYAKIDASSWVGASLFATQHGLL